MRSSVLFEKPTRSLGAPSSLRLVLAGISRNFVKEGGAGFDLQQRRMLVKKLEFAATQHCPQISHGLIGPYRAKLAHRGFSSMSSRSAPNILRSPDQAGRMR
jgi:hypothetical protein